MTLFLISFIAGVLTVLAPCVLPLLPIVIGSSADGRSKATPYIVIGSLAVSILIFTFILKVSTAFIDIPPYVWSYISGGILVGFGLVLVFPSLWERLPFVPNSSVQANKLMGAGHQKKSIWGDVMVGAALGPVFSTCSPTYFVILATVLPASFFLGTLYLLAYIGGLVLVLILIALTGQKLMSKLQIAADSRGYVKQSIGALFFLVGVLIIFGFDKKIESKILDGGYFDVTTIEIKLLENFKEEISAETPEKLNEEVMENKSEVNNVVEVPNHLLREFTDTDFSKSDPNLTNALDGGPDKDGIPAIDNPKFIPLSESDYPDGVQAIVLTGTEQTKAYPYNILTLHEIVNDTFDGTPVAITFCPLCGSAIVYDRTLPDGQVSTFGVSGSLLESNMIMYDRTTENLWQQSTGETLAGSFLPAKLDIVKFQLLDMGSIRKAHPNALILSENTGFRRNYNRNPYSGYETNNGFYFAPSELNTDLPPKTIMAVFRTIDETIVAIPWLALRETGKTEHESNGETYSLETTDAGELNITDSNGTLYPFYFEMWFSVAVQHGDELEVVKL